MTAFDKAWEIAKMPLSEEATEMFGKNICPGCKGSGKQQISSRSRDGFDGEDSDYRFSMIKCNGCNGTGKNPDPEIWGPNGEFANDPDVWDDGREQKNPMEGYE